MKNTTLCELTKTIARLYKPTVIPYYRQELFQWREMQCKTVKNSSTSGIWKMANQLCDGSWNLLKF